MSTYRKIGDGIFFKLKIIFFEFSLFGENQRNCQNRKSVIQDNILKILRTSK